MGHRPTHFFPAIVAATAVMLHGARAPALPGGVPQPAASATTATTGVAAAIDRLSEPATTRTVVLLGATPVLATTAKGTKVVNLAMAPALLKSLVLDLTTPTANLADIRRGVAASIGVAGTTVPTAAILFVGGPDEAARTPDEAVTADLQRTARLLNVAGTTVFVVPSTNALKAGMSATVRIGATAAGAATRYVDLSGELSGKPFDEVFRAIGRTLDAPPPDLAAALEAAATSGKRKASIEAEPGIAAAPDDALTTADIIALDAPAAPAPAPTPVVFNMQPPPPVKAFNPKPPAERIGPKKKAGFSR